MLVLVAGVVVVALTLGAALVIGHSRHSSDRTRDTALTSPTRSASTGSATPASPDPSTPSSSDPATTTPTRRIASPRVVGVRPGYRSVVLTVTGPGDRELRDGGTWSAVSDARHVVVPTASGATRTCASVRSVSPSAALAPSRPVRACGRASDPTMDIRTSSSTCPAFVANGTTYACRYYDVTIAGFRSGSTQRFQIESGCQTKCVKTIRIGQDGRGVLAKAFKALQTQTVTVRAGGITRTVHVS